MKFLRRLLFSRKRYAIGPRVKTTVIINGVEYAYA